LAGARSQLLTLWQVADGATKDLMVSCYAQVRQGAPLVEALHRTQLAVLNGKALPATGVLPRGGWPLGRPDPGTGAALAHPYCWAGFILSGKPERPRAEAP
jgi:CHAT domain-containing protein